MTLKCSQIKSLTHTSKKSKNHQNMILYYSYTLNEYYFDRLDIVAILFIINSSF